LISLGPGTNKILILWDVDLTLVQIGIGRELYADAFQRVTGRPMQVQAPPQGRLDPDIFRDTLEVHGLDVDHYPFPRFAETLASVYSSRSSELRDQGRALPGAADALAALSETSAVQTVVTGNVKPVAIVKLETFDLGRYIDFEIGAYGSEAQSRSDLVGLAQTRAGKKHAVTFEACNTVLIGDSVHDVSAGRDSGTPVIAVTSGRDDDLTLRAAGAQIVLQDLTKTAKFLEAIETCIRSVKTVPEA
jgi:phosphoglycolate phosphatase